MRARRSILHRDVKRSRRYPFFSQGDQEVTGESIFSQGDQEVTEESIFSQGGQEITEESIFSQGGQEIIEEIEFFTKRSGDHGGINSISQDAIWQSLTS
jgi:hypothetical protein